MEHQEGVIKRAEDEIRIFDRPSTNTSKKLISELRAARERIKDLEDNGFEMMETIERNS